jgi:hypothetical protein
MSGAKSQLVLIQASLNDYLDSLDMLLFPQLRATIPVLRDIPKGTSPLKTRREDR